MIALAASDSAHADTYRVRDYTPGVLGEDGSSWAKAFNTIQEALDRAEAHDGDDIIFVARSAPGTAWKPGLTIGAWGALPSGQPLPVQFSTFTIKPGVLSGHVNLRGGFAYDANGGADDWLAMNPPTVLSGDLDGNDVAPTGFATVAALGINGLNAYHVVSVLDVDDNTVIDDFVIERGNVAQQPAPENMVDQRGGGGVLLTSTAQGPPGGLFTPGIAQPVIQNCTIQLNAGRRGGGFLATRTKPAASAEEPLPTVKLRNCTVRANLGLEYGGGIRVENGGIDVADSLIVDNTAQTYGGGAYVTAIPDTLPPVAQRASAKFVHCTIANNVSGASGAGIYWCNLTTRTSSIILDSSIIALNGSGPSDQTSQFSGEYVTATISHCAFPITFASSHIYSSEIFDVQDPYFDHADINTPVLNRTYHVHPCSPIRDRGEPIAANLPLDGKDVNHNDITMELLPDRIFIARILDSDSVIGARTDIGALEHTDTRCLGDANVDGIVDAADLALLLGAWNSPPQSTSPPPCDIAYATNPPTACLCVDWDRDGLIGATDLAVLLGAWGNLCAPWNPQLPGNMMQSGGEESEEAIEPEMTPTDLAWLFDFSSTDELAEWLGTLTPEARLEVLSMLGGS